MGLLDDAIREHLDLKRRHGADPAEIERAEREALGPVRRAPDESESLDQATELAVDPAAYDEDDWDEAELGDDLEDYEIGDEYGLEPPPADEHAPVADPAPLDTPSDADAPFDQDDDSPGSPEASEATGGVSSPAGEAPEPPVPAPEPPAPLEDLPSEETVEYDVESALEEPERKPDDDVLEETPEFLQDTPDHDRLWFEQRPPRDFDLGD